MKGKMAIIADGDGALVFRAAGIDAFRAENAAQARPLLQKLAAEYRVIFVTDTLAAQMEEAITAYDGAAYPIVLCVPSAQGEGGYGGERLRRYSERALGMDILPRAEHKE